MSRPGVTYLEVAEAASRLLGQGTLPTIESIRHLLGTGSSTTLAKHLRQWKSTQNSNQWLAAKENLPEELVSLLKGLWERVLNEAETKITQIEASQQARIDELLPELQKYKSNNQRWQQLFGQWTEEKKRLSLDQDLAEKQWRQAQRENTVLLEKQEALMQQLRDKQERVQELQRLHQQAQTNLEHFRESTRTQRLLDQQRQEGEKRELQAQLKEMTNQQQRLKMVAAQSEKQAQEQLQKAQHFKDLLQEEKARAKHLEQTCLETQTEARILAIQLTQAKKQVLEAKGKNSKKKWRTIKNAMEA